LAVGRGTGRWAAGWAAVKMVEEVEEVEEGEESTSAKIYGFPSAEICENFLMY